MNGQRILAHALMLMLLAPPLSAQSPQTTHARPPQSPQSVPPPPTAQGDDDVVRITTNLVQLDAVVTDKDGRVVTDLRAEDFEVLEDGRPQIVTNLSFIPLEPALATNVAAEDASPVRVAKDKNAPPAPPTPARLRPEQVRRTMALVAGNLSFATTDNVRDALKKYVDEQVQPNDLVSVVSLFGSSGALQRFTTDRRQLARAAAKIRWLPSRDDRDDEELARTDYTTSPTNKQGDDANRQRDDVDSERARTREQIEGSVSGRCRQEASIILALTQIVRGMQPLPGRKSLVFFSDGISIYQGSGFAAGCMENALRLLVDAAARSSVVIYAVDARGVTNPASTSAQYGSSGDNTGARIAGNFESQNGLSYMAENTGGRFIRSQNFMAEAVKTVLADQRGYYLIGYRPAEQTFKGKQFHQIKVRVRRPGLNARARAGFYSLPDSDNSPKSLKGDRQLYAALASPLSGDDVRVQLTSFFGNDPRTGSFVRSLLHINAQDISFADDANGFKKVVLDVAAVTLDESGGVADEFNRTHTVRVGPDAFQHIMLHGLSYSADVPVKRAGAYQLRVVVRDAASGRSGTSGQFVEVPDVGKKQFALSGLVVGEADAQGSALSLPPGANADAALSLVPSATHLSLRRFHPGMWLAYSYVIYNPRLARPANRPQLTTHVRLFREGRELFTSPETPFEPGLQTDSARLATRGTLRLPPDAPPGQYVLQIVVIDLLAKPKDSHRITTQWIDFEIVK